MFYNSLDEAIIQESKTLDLSDESIDQKIINLTELVLKNYADISKLNRKEDELCKKKNDIPLSVHLALKIAKSKIYLSKIKKDIHVSIMFAMYKENNRIKTKNEHDHGENFLIRKIEQLNWLFSDFPNISWNLYLIDDGCPEKSGAIAESIIKDKKLSTNASVLFLQGGINNDLPFCKIQDTSESQKGGSIEYGLWYTSKLEKENHIQIFTDADMSTHLGQIGNIIYPIIEEKYHAAIGSRREDTSISIKKGIRNTRGKLFIYLWKRMIHPLNYITDTQCGLKGFNAEIIKKISDRFLEQKFAFDIELLLKTELIKNRSIKKIPVAWIDSEEASTTTALSPYLNMLKKISEMYQVYLPKSDEAEEFSMFISNLSDKQWDHLTENIPQEIADRDPQEFDLYNEIKASDLKNIIT